jgi:hypothetical protein
MRSTLHIGQPTRYSSTPRVAHPRRPAQPRSGQCGDGAPGVEELPRVGCSIVRVPSAPPSRGWAPSFRSRAELGAAPWVRAAMRCELYVSFFAAVVYDGGAPSVGWLAGRRSVRRASSHHPKRLASERMSTIISGDSSTVGFGSSGRRWCVRAAAAVRRPRGCSIPLARSGVAALRVTRAMGAIRGSQPV